jgi:hypothetical protein
MVVFLIPALRATDEGNPDIDVMVTARSPALRKGVRSSFLTRFVTQVRSNYFTVLAAP